MDGVIHVGSGDGGSGSLFRDAVSHSAADLRARRKSIYYSTEMSEALSSIADDGKRYAFVGVPCFVMAISLLMRQDARLAEQIRFRVGMVGGHLKSEAFAACLSWQTGVPSEELADVEFRTIGRASYR